MKRFTQITALLLASAAAHAASRLDIVQLDGQAPLAVLASEIDTEWRDNNISDGGANALDAVEITGRLSDKALLEAAGTRFTQQAHQYVDDESVLEGTSRLETYSKETIPAISMALAVAMAYNTDNPENLVEFEAPLKKLIRKAHITAANATVVRTCTVFTTLEDGEDGAKNSSYDVMQYIVFNNETREGFAVFAKEGQMGEPPGHVNAGLCK